MGRSQPPEVTVTIGRVGTLANTEPGRVHRMCVLAGLSGWRGACEDHVRPIGHHEATVRCVVRVPSRVRRVLVRFSQLARERLFMKSPRLGTPVGPANRLGDTGEPSS
jgi:hypothetical protein